MERKRIYETKKVVAEDENAIQVAQFLLKKYNK
jgi:hypothetical protein